ncbi:MAG: hypothetical protein SGARI_003598, partial [Bacillariaceae sp.]
MDAEMETEETVEIETDVAVKETLAATINVVAEEMQLDVQEPETAEGEQRPGLSGVVLSEKAPTESARETVLDKEAAQVPTDIAAAVVATQALTFDKKDSSGTQGGGAKLPAPVGETNVDAMPNGSDANTVQDGGAAKTIESEQDAVDQGLAAKVARDVNEVVETPKIQIDSPKRYQGVSTRSGEAPNDDS